MKPLVRLLLLLIPFLLPRPARAEDDDLVLKELALSLWDNTFEARTGVGYKDNVLLSDSNARASGFFATGLEATWLRIPLDGWEVHFSLMGDDYRYWRDIGVDHEDLWLGSAEVRKWFENGWKAGVLGQYAYLNQVLDIFDFVNNVHAPPAPIEGHTFTLRPAVQKQLGSNWWGLLEMDGIRQFFRPPADSFTRYGPRASLGFSYGHHSEVVLSYAIQQTLFDHETAANPDGSPVDGTSLRTWRQQVALGVKHNWDAPRHWQTGLRLGFTDTHDAGSGYFAYREYSTALQLRYAAHGWEIKGAAGLLYRDFPVQAVSLYDPSKFRQTLTSVSVRVEKTLTKWLKLYGAWEREVSLADSPDEVYHANTITAGLGWIF